MPVTDGPNKATGQVVLSTTSAEVVPARNGRKRVVLKNIDAAITIYHGEGTVTATNGMPLLAGESDSVESSGAVNAIAASGTARVAYREEYS